MMKSYDLLIKGGRLVDPGSNREGRFDVALEGGLVAEVAPDISIDLAREVFDAAGKLVLPGLVDTHVHLTPPKRAVGFRMLARAGVTCCLDCAGPIEDVIQGMAESGAGISTAVLNRLDPGGTISGPDASRQEVSDYLTRSLDAGALGVKLLGGHLPLSPETTIAAIEAANQAGAYVAFHCGSTKNGSNLFGLMDALEFAGKNRLHVCHVNAYCRGNTHGSPVKETMIALEELAARPHLVSESHLAPYNSCWARLTNDVPRSHVTRTCLEMGHFTPDRSGLIQAAESGYMRVQMNAGYEVVYLPPDQGAAYLKEVNFETMVSFPVNRRSTAFLCAAERHPDGRFIVTALSTDGGGIPRNFLLSHGLTLVRFDAMTLSELVMKCAWLPARMLGLFSKGHLAPGADGDLVVVDGDRQTAVMTVAEGRIVMVDNVVLGTSGTIITTERGQKSLRAGGVPARAADLSQSLLYNAPDRTGC